MLDSTSVSDQDMAYQNAAIYVVDDLRMMEELFNIYDNPSYYAGYYLKNIRENL